ncbi:putative indole-3-pyruvate monooxygenase YUCCA10 [Senna tora]|uniref:indole-3-pyruvate monooxygenase n=1 Tax=Senna tora TaxID=362788 RepID=A0A834XAF3_9FABA|nr:putative indole-3-pyruvate monooxygenase YUCCA10 [Senna tora]
MSSISRPVRQNDGVRRRRWSSSSLLSEIAKDEGLATSACLKRHSIPHIILEKEDCSASLWRKNTYNRVKLHLAKEFCSLPFMPHPPSSPTFLSKKDFLHYIDDYITWFDIRPRYCRLVESVAFDEVERKWRIETRNTNGGSLELREAYVAKYVVVASGENSEGYVPKVEGLEGFSGEIVHSKSYKCSLKYKSKGVLVVGSRNSGMEIAYDLNDWGARTSIIIRSGNFGLRTSSMFLMKMGCRKMNFQGTGKETMGYTVQGYQEEVCLEFPWMQRLLPTISIMLSRWKLVRHQI